MPVFGSFFPPICGNPGSERRVFPSVYGTIKEMRRNCEQLVVARQEVTRQYNSISLPFKNQNQRSLLKLSLQDTLTLLVTGREYDSNKEMCHNCE